MATVQPIARAAGRTSPEAGDTKAARTRLLLEAPILPALLRLAAPNVLNLVALSIIVTVDGFYVGWLGPAALAGVSLVFPVKMLMQHMAASGMGGAVTASIARALGAGQPARANSLAVHGLGIAAVMAAVFMVGVLAGGEAMFRAMGARDEPVRAALAYSRVVFAGAITPWLFNTLASIVRGTGNMTLPAAAIVTSACVDIVLSPALIFGWGPWPRLGVAGAGLGFVLSFLVGSAMLLRYLLWGPSLVRLQARGFRLDPALLRDILRVGAPGSINTVLANVTIVLLTGLVGPLGTTALAGYGMGARLEYILIPLAFGFGTALVAMVGTNIGAGQTTRARAIAWQGAGLIGAITGVIGVVGALFPRSWISMFSRDADVVAAGATYLRIVGPFYGFFGLGLGLYFASQGAGRLLWPLLANVLRLLLVFASGWTLVHRYSGELSGVCAAIAAGFVLYGVLIATAMLLNAWGIKKGPATG